jgi:SAM-dependent methyltransferase
MDTGVGNVSRLGYSPEQVGAIPAPVLESNAGCGTPLAHARPRAGETVLDLGSGGGLDCFLAAQEVGPGGRVIGLDMTDAMLQKAEENRRTLGLSHVEFRKGEMEAMPVDGGTVDIIISNCVINLSPDKAAVFRESFRVLRPGGRFVVSDVVKTGEGGEGSMEEWCACIAGALSPGNYLAGLRAAGFENAEIVETKPYIAQGHESAIIRAIKPGAR